MVKGLVLDVFLAVADVDTTPQLGLAELARRGGEPLAPYIIKVGQGLAGSRGPEDGGGGARDGGIEGGLNGRGIVGCGRGGTAVGDAERARGGDDGQLHGGPFAGSRGHCVQGQQGHEETEV